MNPGNILIAAPLVLSCIIPFLIAKSIYSGNSYFYMISKKMYYATGAILFVAIGYLLVAFIMNDFRYLYVFNNSSLDTPLLYRISSIWSGQEGSFLLWVFVLNVCGIIALKDEEGNGSILLSIIILSQIFILLSLVANSPFEYVWERSTDGMRFIPDDGAGMNPLLQDPWMITHPPFLYLGYASAAIPFGYAVTSLLKNDYSLIVKKGYKWILFSFTTLGIGIFMGGYWAYKVLGWGGYWKWDPVENSSLIPWLVVLVLVHGILIQKRSESLIRINIALACIYYIMVFCSFFLTRSGILADFSVHSFGEQGLTGYLLSYIIFFSVASIFIFFIRYRYVPVKKITEKWSFAAITSLGMLTLALYTIFIFFGTWMPVFSGLTMTNPVSADESYYNSISIVFGSVILILIILATSITVLRSMKGWIIAVMIILSVVSGLMFNLLNNIVSVDLFALSLKDLMFQIRPDSTLISILCFFLILLCFNDIFKKRLIAILPSRLSHIGVGILILGFISSNIHSTTEQDVIFKDISKKINGVDVVLRGFDKQDESLLTLTIKWNSVNADIKTKYFFSSRTNSLYIEPFIESGFFGDIYIVPDDYQSGLHRVTVFMLKKNEEKKIEDLSLKFLDFETKHMTSEEPSITANLVINNRLIPASMAFKNNEKVGEEIIIPETKRIISLIDVDATTKSVLVYISPGANTVIPPDRVIVSVSQKRFIWLVWLGTIFISTGGIFAMTRRLARS